MMKIQNAYIMQNLYLFLIFGMVNISSRLCPIREIIFETLLSKILTVLSRNMTQEIVLFMERK